LQLQASPYVAAGRGYLVTGLHAGRTVLRARSAQLHDWTAWHCEVGNPNVVVAIHDRSPRAGETALAVAR
jgi:hypothetical protein